MPQGSSNNTSTQVGFYNVPQRPVIKKNLDMYAKAMDNLYEQHREAIQQRSAIDIALSQIELDESENEWKYNYAQRIRDQIDAKARYGDYSGALDTATMLASTAVSSPELLGRQKAHKDREDAWDQVQKRNDIDEDTKRAWNLSNKYYYRDETDAQGHVVGGSKWEANWSPVSHVDVVPELAKAVSLIAPEQRSSSSTTGGTTVKSDGTSTGGQHGSGSSYQRLTIERIDKQLRQYIEGNPQLKASILQEYKVNKILLKDAEDKLARATTDEERAALEAEVNMRKSNLTNHNGINTGDYMTVIYKKYSDVINNFAYNNTTSTSTDINNTDDYVKGTTAGGGGGGGGSYTPGSGQVSAPFPINGGQLGSYYNPWNGGVIVDANNNVDQLIQTHR